MPFIEGVPGYAVSIALVSREGVPQIGVVYDPVEHTLYHAVKGQGAYRNCEPWELPDPGPRLRIFTDRSAAAQPWFTKVNETLQAEVTSHGGGVMNAIWVLENAPACYFKFPKEAKGGGCVWDFAATACIYHELGAVASDIHGAALELNRPESIFMNHNGILFASDTLLAERICSYYSDLSNA